MKTALLLAASAAIFTGCQTLETGALPPQNTTKFDTENREPFVLMDRDMQAKVTCSGILKQPLEDGRLQVTANVRNRDGHRHEVQVQCVFKDAAGFPTGDETPWQTLILTENGQEGVRFASMNDRAKSFTIRVRKPR